MQRPKKACMTPPKSFLVFVLLGSLLAAFTGIAQQVSDAGAAKPTCEQRPHRKCDPQDTTPPAVTLESPERHAPGQYTSIDGIVDIEATATDNQDVESVAFWAGSIPLGVDTEAPYEAKFDSAVWPNWQTSFIKAVATDTIGNTAEDLRYVQVVRQASIPTPDTEAPKVKLTNPGGHAPGEYTSIQGVISVEADASDNVAVQSVDLYAGSIKLGSLTSAPWRASFDTSVWPNGQVSYVKSIARDGAGNSAEDIVYVRVVRTTTSVVAACADTKDNDGDGKIDYPADTGCTSATDTDETNTTTLAACADTKDNDGDGKVDYPADTGCSNATDGDETNALGAGPKVAWAPPQLSSPTTVNVPATGGLGSLDPSRDYILNLGHRRTGLEIVGGRNVVVMGGRVTCESIVDSNLAKGRGIVITNTQGAMHIEGVLFENCGDGIAIRAPQAIVQLQNLRFEDIDSPWSINHPDVIQTWNGPREVRIDRLTADFSSKGFLWMSTTGTFPQRVDQRHVNFRLWSQGGATPDGPATYTWHPSATTRSTCDDCWSEMGWWQNVYRRRLQDGWGTFDKAGGGWEFIPYRIVGADGRRVEVETQAEHDSLVNDNLGRRQGDYMERLTPSLAGERWHWGLPGGGDFVPPDLPGTGYVSPGYS